MLTQAAHILHINPISEKGGGYMGGSIQWDKKSRSYYIAVYWEGRHHRIWRNPHTGEKLYDKRQANKVLGRIQTEVDTGEFHPRFWKPDNPLTILNYHKEWLARITVSEKTKRDYGGYFKNHIIPEIGGLDVRHIRYKHLEALYKNIGLSDKGKYNVMGALKTMLRWAYCSEDIKRVPPFPALSYTLPEIEYLTLNQQNQILTHIPERDRPIFEFAMEYGLRVGEVRALQKDCVTSTEIIIRRAFSENTLRERTKTGTIRRFEKTDFIKILLGNMQPQLSPFVFVRKDGKPYTNKNLNALWKEACKQAGIKIKLYNAFRHSLGCQLLDQGEDIDLVRHVLGHTKSDMTRRYAKRSNNILTSALEKRRGKIIELKY